MIEYKGNEKIDHGSAIKDFTKSSRIDASNIQKHMEQAKKKSNTANDKYLLGIKRSERRRLTNKSGNMDKVIGKSKMDRLDPFL